VAAHKVTHELVAVGGNQLALAVRLVFEEGPLVGITIDADVLALAAAAAFVVQIALKLGAVLVLHLVLCTSGAHDFSHGFEDG